MPDGRPDPEALLASLPREQEATAKRAKLKIFLGASVGARPAMLVEAHERRRASATWSSAVVGDARPPRDHGAARRARAAAAPLRRAPRRHADRFDLDGALAAPPRAAAARRAPHTQRARLAPPPPLAGRQELLDAGIDVATTLNVQHDVESLVDGVAQITGVTVRETVPTPARPRRRIEVVDLPPDDLLQRLREGKVYDAAAGRARRGGLLPEEPDRCASSRCGRRRSDVDARWSPTGRAAGSSPNRGPCASLLVCLGDGARRAAPGARRGAAWRRRSGGVDRRARRDARRVCATRAATRLVDVAGLAGGWARGRHAHRAARRH